MKKIVSLICGCLFSGLVAFQAQASGAIPYSVLRDVTLVESSDARSLSRIVGVWVQPVRVAPAGCINIGRNVKENIDSPWKGDETVTIKKSSRSNAYLVQVSDYYDTSEIVRPENGTLLDRGLNAARYGFLRYDGIEYLVAADLEDHYCVNLYIYTRF